MYRYLLSLTILFFFTTLIASPKKRVKNPFICAQKDSGCIVKDPRDGLSYYWEFNSEEGTFTRSRLDSNLSWKYDKNKMLLGSYEDGECNSLNIYDRYGFESIKVGTIGKDNRELLTELEKKKPEIKQIGMLVNDRGLGFTSIVTGKNCDKVLVAAHAVVSENGVRSSKFSYYPDVQNPSDKIKATPVVVGWNMEGKFRHGSYDFAVFKLSEPAHIDQYGRPSCKQIDIKEWDSSKPAQVNCKGHLSLVGFNHEDFDMSIYGKNTPKHKRIVRKCSSTDERSKVITVTDEEFQHDCDTNDMTSGAPIFCNEDRKMSLVGMHTSSDRDNPDGNRIGDIGPAYDNDLVFNAGVSMWNKEFLRAIK